MSEFKGKAGTIYVQQTTDENSLNEKPFEVWFEDFYILGTGRSDIEALQDAKRHADDIVRLISDAVIRTLCEDDAGDVHRAAGSGD